MTLTEVIDSERGRVGFYIFIVDVAIILALVYFLGDSGSRWDSFWILTASWFGLIIFLWIRRSIVRHFVIQTSTRSLVKQLLESEFGRLERPDTDFAPVANRPTDWLQCYAENSEHSPEGRVVASRLSGELEISYSNWDPFGPSVGEEACAALERFQKFHSMV